MNASTSTTQKGGRPPKEEQDRASIKLNCWVTIGENKQLRAEYSRMIAGRKLPFANYLKQKLLHRNVITPAKTNEMLLTILINLQDRSRQLDEIQKQLSTGQGSEGAKIAENVSVELVAIQETLTKISQWLYES